MNKRYLTPRKFFDKAKPKAIKLQRLEICLLLQDEWLIDKPGNENRSRMAIAMNFVSGPLYSKWARQMNIEVKQSDDPKPKARMICEHCVFIKKNGSNGEILKKQKEKKRKNKYTALA